MRKKTLACELDDLLGLPLPATPRKPKLSPKLPDIPCIYVAGRISEKSRLRFGVNDCTISSSEIGSLESHHAEVRDCIRDGYRFRYSGPYTGSCDHACGHAKFTRWPINDSWGSSSHGLARSACFEDGDWDRHTVFKRSLDGIDKADVVFAWIEDQECYGTLFEIGYAIKTGKPVYLAHHPSIKPNGDLWFSFTAATDVASFDTAKEAYIELIKAVGSPAKNH